MMMDFNSRSSSSFPEFITFVLLGFNIKYCLLFFAQKKLILPVRELSWLGRKPHNINSEFNIIIVALILVVLGLLTVKYILGPLKELSLLIILIRETNVHASLILNDLIFKVLIDAISMVLIR